MVSPLQRKTEARKENVVPLAEENIYKDNFKSY